MAIKWRSFNKISRTTDNCCNRCNSVSTRKAPLVSDKNPIADLATLEIALKAELTKNPEIGVHLYADQNVIYAKMAEVMATVQHAGIAKLAFVTVEQ